MFIYTYIYIIYVYMYTNMYICVRIYIYTYHIQELEASEEMLRSCRQQLHLEVTGKDSAKVSLNNPQHSMQRPSHGDIDIQRPKYEFRTS